MFAFGFEADASAGDGDDARLHVHAEALRSARVRADQCVAPAESLSDARVDADAQQPEAVEPPEDVAAADR